MRRRVRRSGWVLALGMAGCAKPRTAEAPDPASAAEAPSTVGTAPEGDVPLDLSPELASIEQNLLELDIAMRFAIESEGAVASKLVGELRLQGDTLQLRASGTFADQPVELSLQADGQRKRGQGGASEISIPQPPELERAVVLGLLRMGLLHNLAMLVSGRPPDHADGGVDPWLRAAAVVPGAKMGPAEPGPDAQHHGAESMSFQIQVERTHAGDATLWWDPSTKLPLERHVVVRFPDGDMRVQERYTIEILGRE